MYQSCVWERGPQFESPRSIKILIIPHMPVNPVLDHFITWGSQEFGGQQAYLNKASWLVGKSKKWERVLEDSISPFLIYTCIGSELHTRTRACAYTHTHTSAIVVRLSYDCQLPNNYTETSYWVLKLGLSLGLFWTSL